MKSRTIIVVDDSPPLRARIKEVIECFPDFILLAEACNGSEAIELIKTEKPDYVTLDINMPEKTGIEVLEAIKPHENDISVIIITNHADQIYRKKCKNLGAKFFLDKSKEFHTLKDILGP